MDDEPSRAEEMDVPTIDQLDQGIFDLWSESSDAGDDDIPLPDCIGIDSALQDDEKLRLESLNSNNPKNKSRDERELELRVLKPDSIRRQILERSLSDSNDSPGPSVNSSNEATSGRSHVMNIIEKAGMSGIDKEKINQVIHEASKGSKFYLRQAQLQAKIHKNIESMLNRVKSATPAQIETAKNTCDKMLNDLENQRVFNKIIVHFDLDMFFAAVEIRDDPSLKDKPVAVGGDSMVSTSNYVARRFGVRAAMPGFIARKLCPELILIRPNGFKYRQASSEVFSILEQYDPDLTNMSLDEAYLDLTENVMSSLERDGLESQEYYDGTLPRICWTRANEIVEEIRQAIFDKTKLTCSAGIACNTLLAKISTDINKPNGQFMIQGYSRDVLDFISETRVEKVSGIGKVSVQFLNALDIKTCGDILAKRHFLPLVFHEINVKFYLRVALGDGSTTTKSDDQRKSKSVERTFQAIKDSTELLKKLDNICDELCDKYLKPYKIRGRTVTVKLKRNTFTTTTRSFSMLVHTNEKKVIFSAAKNLLLSEIANEPPEISYRLLGVKISNLADDGVTTNQLTIDAMLKNQGRPSETKSNQVVHRVSDEPQGNASREEILNQLNSIDRENSASSSNKDTIRESLVERTQKRSSPTELSSRDSFFRKRPRSSSESNTSDFPPSIAGESEFFSPEQDEEATGSTSRSDKVLATLDEAPLAVGEEQHQPGGEDFQCPYCFKPVSGFPALESHVENCRFKTSFDVNKSFFSQKSQAVLSPTTSVKSKAKTSKSKAFFRKFLEQKSETLATSTQGPDESLSQIAPKPSFYQQFIDSNSQSLSQAKKTEPLRCPYCCHGFLHFSSLETHVMICTKRQSK